MSGFVLTSLNAATATGAGTALTFNVPLSDVGMLASTTGSPSSVEVDLEITIDGVTWQSVGSFTGSPNPFIIGRTQQAITGVRANLVTLTGGSSPTVTAVVSAVPKS